MKMKIIMILTLRTIKYPTLAHDKKFTANLKIASSGPLRNEYNIILKFLLKTWITKREKISIYITWENLLELEKPWGLYVLKLNERNTVKCHFHLFYQILSPRFCSHYYNYDTFFALWQIHHCHILNGRFRKHYFEQP